MFTAKNVIGWRDKQPDENDVVINNNVGNMSDEDLGAKIDEKLKALEGKK